MFTEALFTLAKTSVQFSSVAQWCPTLCNPMDYTVYEILQARILEWVAYPFSRGSSQPRDQTQVSCIAGGFFTSCATGEFQEYSWNGVGSLSLLQQIFLIQESNPGLLHCRRILYQLSHQGSQEDIKMLINTWKKAQHCSLLEKCKSKLQWGITSHWSEWPSSKNLQTISAGESVEKRKPSCAVGGKVNWYHHYGEQHGDSLKN